MELQPGFLICSDELERAKKDMRKQKEEYESKIKGLNEKINSL